jgi:hypothetical protein
MDFKDAKLHIEKWSDNTFPSDFGTIRTKENYYVATILNSGKLRFDGIEAMTRDFPQEQIITWFNAIFHMPQRGY